VSEISTRTAAASDMREVPCQDSLFEKNSSWIICFSCVLPQPLPGREQTFPQRLVMGAGNVCMAWCQRTRLRTLEMSETELGSASEAEGVPGAATVVATSFVAC